MVFSGIVEGRGIVKEITSTGGLTQESGMTLKIQPESSSFINEDISVGCSIAVNGTCVTVTEFTSTWFKVDLAPETLRKTVFGDVRESAVVNLERALKASDRNSGHTVQGHIDGVGEIVSMKSDGVSIRVRISTTRLEKCAKTRKYMNSLIVPKGFIAVDGASLTVCEVSHKEEWFTLMLIPHTQDVLKPWHKGEFVNLELDCLAKYVSSSVTCFVDPVVHKLKKRLRRSEIFALASTVVSLVCLGIVLRRK